MRIFTGPNSDETLYAAHWFGSRVVRRWQNSRRALYLVTMDCPSSGPAFATISDPKSTKAYVLGTLEVHIEKSVPVGQDYVITCSLDEDTGKLYKTRVSLYDGQGQHYAPVAERSGCRFPAHSFTGLETTGKASALS